MSPYTRVPLGRILRRSHESIVIDPQEVYRQVTVRLFHKGVVLRGEKDGSSIRTTRQSRIRAGQILLSRIDARHGAIGQVPPTLDGAIVTNDFWAFDVDPVADPHFLDAYFGTPDFIEACGAASEGTTNRVRLRPERFLQLEIPLPSIEEQRRIVTRIGGLAAKVSAVEKLREQADNETRQLLLGVYHDLVKGAQLLPMSEVAPLVRRPINAITGENYHELGIRSFGKGTFHKAPLSGADLGTKRIFRIETGDLLFNIVFAWEGAVAVATAEDHGRVGSHRFLTCVPKKGTATAAFLCFHFLTAQGLEDISAASPGGAGRNRTLGLRALEQIRVPVPDHAKQVWFDSLLLKFQRVAQIRNSAKQETDALMPSILDKALRGNL